MPAPTSGTVLGFDFGTTNSVAAQATGAQAPDMLAFDAPDGSDAVFRSALCFWQDETIRGGMGIEAGPWAIAEYLEYPQDSRFVQSFKSVAASARQIAAETTRIGLGITRRRRSVWVTRARVRTRAAVIAAAGAGSILH